MSFLKKLFGGGSQSAQSASAPAASEDYNGFTIEAAPYPEAGQFQLCGIIRKTIDGAVKEHRFVRADRFASKEDAVSYTLVKGRQIVDQQGDRVFG